MVNFVTRKHFEGLQLEGQAGFANGYNTLNSAILWGERWNDASLMLAGSYSYRSILRSDARDYLNPNHIAQGGANFNTFNCERHICSRPARQFISFPAAATTGTSTAQTGAPCNTNAYTALAPSDMRLNGMMRFEKDIGKDIVVGVDAVYSNRMDKRPVARGTLTATLSRPDRRANPSTQIRLAIRAPRRPRRRAGMLTRAGTGGLQPRRRQGLYVDTTFDYRFAGDWHLTLLALYGSEDNNVARLRHALRLLRQSGIERNHQHIWVPDTGFRAGHEPAGAGAPADRRQCCWTCEPGRDEPGRRPPCARH